MNIGEVWISKEDLDQGEDMAIGAEAIKLLKYLDNDEWKVEFGEWDFEDQTYSSDGEFCEDEDVTDEDEEFIYEDTEGILTGKEIFRAYTRVCP
jgi:hypothetical protein